MQPQIILIDGPSGSGKTSLAMELAVASDKQLLHLDDVYPGWSGLRAGIEIIAQQVLGAEESMFYQWDWENNCPGQPRTVDTTNLIIEGVGALAPEIIAACQHRAVGVLLHMPEELRKQRALSRDPSFAPYWDMWADQELAHFSKIGGIMEKLPVMELETIKISRGEGGKIVTRWLRELSENRK